MEPQPQQIALTYLTTHNVITLATHGPEGLWAAAVFYVNNGFTLYFLSSPASRHGLNIAANPEVSATIQEDYADWPAIKGIQLEGNVQQIHGAEKLQTIKRYGEKFPVLSNLDQAPKAILAALDKVAWYKLTPTRLYFVDNAQGFGHRDQISLPFLGK